MTVEAQIPVVEYQATGVSTEFDYPFLVLKDSDLKVWLDEVDLTTGFIKQGIGNAQGGKVVFAVEPTGLLRLERDIPLSRMTDYPHNGDFNASVVNADFDRLWLALQGVSAKMRGVLRTVASETIGFLPRQAERANKALGFDAQGNPVAIPSDLPAVQGMLQEVLDAKAVAETAAANAEKSAGEAGTRVPMSGPTGVMYVPEGNDSQRPAPEDIPEGVAAVRGNATSLTDYFLELWNRKTEAWDALASRNWVTNAINSAKTAIENWVDGLIGHTIIYPNGGTAAAPANISVNQRYVLSNPFPGYHVACKAEVLISGEWSSTGWMYAPDYPGGAGVFGSQHDGQHIVLRTGSGRIYAVAGEAGGTSNVTTSSSAALPCRVLVWKVGSIA